MTVPPLKEGPKKGGINPPRKNFVRPDPPKPITDKLADHLAYPPRALRAERAAAYLSMSTAMFLKLVDEGRLPKPKRLGGMVFWDRAKLDEFVEFFEGDD